MKLIFSKLQEGDFFSFKGEIYVKIRDTGYLFGIANSKNIKTYKWELIPVGAEVEVLNP